MISEGRLVTLTLRAVPGAHKRDGVAGHVRKNAHSPGYQMLLRKSTASWIDATAALCALCALA